MYSTVQYCIVQCRYGMGWDGGGGGGGDPSEQLARPREDVCRPCQVAVWSAVPERGGEWRGQGPNNTHMRTIHTFCNISLKNAAPHFVIITNNIG